MCRVINCLKGTLNVTELAKPYNLQLEVRQGRLHGGRGQ